MASSALSIVPTFSQSESEDAFKEWGANCGPNALASVMGMHIQDIEGIIPEFGEKRYTSPAMMTAALVRLRAKVDKWRIRDVLDKNLNIDAMFSPVPALVRIQWCGPWTRNMHHYKWAARQTHWIATQKDETKNPFVHDDSRFMVFDVNGGLRTFSSWKHEVLPPLVSSIPDATGDWYPLQIWRVKRPKR